MSNQIKEQNDNTKTNSDFYLEIRVVIFTLKNERLQILFTRSAKGIQKNLWFLPGKAVISGQALEKTAKTLVLSLTGLNEAYLEQLYTYGDIDRNPQGHCISVAYFALIPSDAFVTQSIDDLEIKWFPINEHPQLAYDHSEILEYAFRRLRYKLEYSAVGFELLPDNFSLSELQHTYELILGEELDKRNFRRRILAANVIEPTPHQRSGEGRPARLYQYKADAVAEIKARRLFP